MGKDVEPNCIRLERNLPGINPDRVWNPVGVLARLSPGYSPPE
ncbi:hypothetical protein ES705_25208 [subsurface metagenome]